MELRRIVVARPPVLGLSVEKSLEPKLDYLERRLGLRREQMHKVVLELPSVLSLSTESNLEPTIGYYTRVWSLSGDELREMVMAYPPALSCSEQAQLVPITSWLKVPMTHQPAAPTRRRSNYHPSAYFHLPTYCSHPTFRSPSLSPIYLQNKLSLDSSALKSLVLAYPQICGFTVGALDAGLAYCTAKFGPDDAVARIVEMPAMLEGEARAGGGGGGEAGSLRERLRED